MKNIILIGDSIRMGYQPEVTRALADLASVWGPEINGGDSANVLAHLESWVLTRPCDLLHLNCGLHDIKRSLTDDTYQVPLADYQANLSEILRRVREARGDLPIIWATTTPVIDEQHNAVKDSRRYESDVLQYNAAALAIAQEAGLIINDLHRYVHAVGIERIIRGDDGVHYTEAGYTQLGTEVARQIRDQLTQQ